MAKKLALVAIAVAAGLVFVMFSGLVPSLSVTNGNGPVLVFEGRITTTAANVNPSDTVNDETLVITPDGKRGDVYDDRTDIISDTDGVGADVANWDYRTEVLIINKNTIPQATRAVFIVAGVLSKVDALPDTTNAFPYMVTRDTVDITQYDVDWSLVSGLDSVTQYRDEAKITSNYGEQGTVRADAEMQITSLDGMVLGTPYCMTYLVAGVQFVSCLIANVA